MQLHALGWRVPFLMGSLQRFPQLETLAATTVLAQVKPCFSPHRSKATTTITQLRTRFSTRFVICGQVSRACDRGPPNSSSVMHSECGLHAIAVRRFLWQTTDTTHHTSRITDLSKLKALSNTTTRQTTASSNRPLQYCVRFQPPS